MDQLEILKKDWDKQENTFQKFSQKDLSTIIHKRSSSIVKWIFIISLLEFALPLVLLLFTDIEKVSKERYDQLGLSNFRIISYSIYYAVILYFVFRFYKNYKSISAYSNPKALLKNILNTRKIVKYYIWFNLAITPIITGVILYKTLNSPLFADKLSHTNNIIIVLLSFVLMAIMLALIWLFYRLLYGILLNKLKHNYNELISNDDC